MIAYMYDVCSHRQKAFKRVCQKHAPSAATAAMANQRKISSTYLHMNDEMNSSTPALNAESAPRTQSFMYIAHTHIFGASFDSVPPAQTKRASAEFRNARCEFRVMHVENMNATDGCVTTNVCVTMHAKRECTISLSCRRMCASAARMRFISRFDIHSVFSGVCWSLSLCIANASFCGATADAF